MAQEKDGVDDPQVIAGRSFGSRLLPGTGRFPCPGPVKTIWEGDAIEVVRLVRGG